MAEQGPNLFGLPPGVDVPQALIDGLSDHVEIKAPEDWARITLILNTRRMARRVRAIFDAGPAQFLPRILLLNEVDTLLTSGTLQQPVSPLRRRLELARLVTRLLEERKDFAARGSVFDLADSLARLLDEMHGEGVSPQTVASLDVGDHSAHFAQTQAFLGIVSDYLGALDGKIDTEAHQRAIVEALTAEWQDNPPGDPIILAGSTASRSTTRLLAQAVAALPKGAVILPGFDTLMPDEVWESLDAGDLPVEDHPQYRFLALIDHFGLRPSDVKPWGKAAPHTPERNALISLALRPSPMTDAWREEGPHLPNLARAVQNVTLLEADTPRNEALAIAMRLRQAAEQNERAALVTPDRMLARQVAAALDRWGIVPDDSAGMPLHLTPVGRFVRHVFALYAEPLTAERLLVLLKHPLTHTGASRNLHLLTTQRLEMRMRRDGMPFPDRDSLISAVLRDTPKRGADLPDWAQWLTDCVCGQQKQDRANLGQWVNAHKTLVEAVAKGSEATSSDLWTTDDGQAVAAVFDELDAQADAADALTVGEYRNLLEGLLAAEEVRNPDTPRPGIMIWGTLEARVHGADLVILGSLNDGTWPETPAPDPWLNRALRQKAGLLLPDRRIGLSAHDFQQAVAAKTVWLTRSIRTSEAETVPSRWLNRLTNLLGGLKDTGGAAALQAMQARGQVWQNKAEALEAPIPSRRAVRPAPAPPVPARPRIFSVSDIRNLVRDPYAVYAKHCLRLRPLGPLVPRADALARGTALHLVLEHFISKTVADPDALTAGRFVATASEILQDEVPWPATRALWLARLKRNAEQFMAEERHRQDLANPTAFEKNAKGKLLLPDIGVTVTARADRIDQSADGALRIYDYKTGTPPTKKEQIHFERQLLIEAAMAEEGGFPALGARPVTTAQYIGLGPRLQTVDAPLDEEPPAKLLSELRALIAAYLEPEQGFSSRRAMRNESAEGDFDQLARFGEWDTTHVPVTESVGE